MEGDEALSYMLSLSTPRYVELYGRKLTTAARVSVEGVDWLHHKEPRAPRPVCDVVISCVTGTCTVMD